VPVVSTMANIAVGSLGFGRGSSDYWQAIINDANFRNSTSYAQIYLSPNGNLIIAFQRDNISSTYNGAGIVALNKQAVFQWERSMYYTTQNMSCNQAAIDSSNNIYLMSCSVTDDDQLLTKLDSSGSHQWTRRFYTTDQINGGGIAINSTDASLYFTSGINTTSPDIGITKFATSGLTITWDEKFSSANTYDDLIHYCALDSSENIYILARDLTEDNPVVAKYNSSGTFQWGKAYVSATSSNSANINGIVVDSSDNVYFSFADLTLHKLYLVKINSSNVVQWTRSISASGETFSNTGDLAIDSSDNIYMTASLSTSGAQKGIIAKYNSSGTLQFQRKVDFTVGGAIPSFGDFGIAVDADSMYLDVQIDGRIWLARLPKDGSNTGSWTTPVTMPSGSGVFTYSASSFTDASATLTTGTNPASSTLTWTYSATTLPSNSTTTPTVAKGVL